jgi:hypothetical protein
MAVMITNAATMIIPAITIHPEGPRLANELN